MLDQATDYVCWGNFYYNFMNIGVMPVTSFIMLLSYTYLMKWCFLRRTGRPLKSLFCSELFFFDLILTAEMTWFFLSLYPAVTAANNRLTESVGSVREFFVFQINAPLIQPYFVGLIFFVFQLRFFFSLKVTRLFGPFTKLIKLFAKNLLVWLIFTVLLIFTGGLYFSTLLSQSTTGCSGTYSCVKILIEASVGRVLFRSSDPVSHLSLMVFTLVSGAILMNMVIAKINSTYQEVTRKGTLHYYKDLFDQRYLFSLDSQYGYLVALEHPLSAFLVPTLCYVKCLERRRKRRELNLSAQLKRN